MQDMLLKYLEIIQFNDGYIFFPYSELLTPPQTYLAYAFIEVDKKNLILANGMAENGCFFFFFFFFFS